jgi:hypothetical protein
MSPSLASLLASPVLPRAGALRAVEQPMGTVAFRPVVHRRLMLGFARAHGWSTRTVASFALLHRARRNSMRADRSLELHQRQARQPLAVGECERSGSRCQPTCSATQDCAQH